MIFAEADCKACLAFLEDAAARHQVAIHALVLMTLHVQLLLTSSEPQGVSRMMQALGRKYVQHFTFTHARSGTLWEGRYPSTLVDADNHLLRCIAISS